MRRRAVAVLAGSALTLSLSGTATSQAGVPSAHPAVAKCVRQALAAALGVDGKYVWRVALPATSTEYQTSFAPAIGGTIGYWPQDGIVHALRLRDGKQLWQVKQGVSLDGVWLNHGVVSVLTDDFGGGGVLTGLNAVTGKLKWRLKIPGKGLTIGSPAATSDGGLAWVRADGEMQVVDLTTGKVRWSVRQGTPAQIATQFPQMVTSLGRIFYLAGGRLSAYDDKTGVAAWSLHKMPVHATLSTAGGEPLVDGGWTNAPYALGAFDPKLGTALWQFNPGAEVDVLAFGGGRIAVTSTPTPGQPQEYVLDQHTGGTDWLAPAPVTGNPVILGSKDTVAVEGADDYDKPALLVDRDPATGAVRWFTTLLHQAAVPGGLTIAGSTVLLEPDGEFANPYAPLYAFSLLTGHPVFSAPHLRPLQAPPAVAKAKTLYLTAADASDLC